MLACALGTEPAKEVARGSFKSEKSVIVCRFTLGKATEDIWEQVATLLFPPQSKPIAASRSDDLFPNWKHKSASHELSVRAVSRIGCLTLYLEASGEHCEHPFCFGLFSSNQKPALLAAITLVLLTLPAVPFSMLSGVGSRMFR